MSDDFITRAEHAVSVARLEAADDRLQDKILETERYLRAEVDEKVADAISHMKEDLNEVRNDLRTDIKEVKDHLIWQDKTIGGGLVTLVITILIAVFRHQLGL